MKCASTARPWTRCATSAPATSSPPSCKVGKAKRAHRTRWRWARRQRRVCPWNLHNLATNALGERGFHEPIERPIQDLRRVGALDTGPEVLDQLIGLQDIGPDLVAPADVGLSRRLCRGGRLALLQLKLVQAGAKHFPRRGAILVLRALALALDNDVGRDVGQANR